MATLFQRISLGVGVLILMFAVLVSAVAVARNINLLDESFRNAERPAEVSRTLIRLRLAVADAETAQRGYLLTDDLLFLEPYQGTRLETDSLLTRLDTLVSRDPVQARRMPGLRRAVRGKEDEMDRVLALRRAEGTAEAVAAVRTARGAVLMTEIRTRIAEMLVEAGRVRDLSADRVGLARRRAFLATAITDGILFGLIVAGALLLRRHLQSREKAAESLLRNNTQLSQAVAEREAALVHVQSMQAQLVQQEKLAGLGRLTAGVAHELKNPLNFVNNFALLAGELAAEAQAAFEAGQPDEARALLPDLRLNVLKVSEHGQRADEIVRTMLVHARGVSGEREPVDLADVLATAATQAAGPVDGEHRTVRVVREIHADLDGTTISGIPSALGRMFLNLIENAVQATRERAGFEGAAYEPEVRIEAHRGRDRLGHDVVLVTIADNGAGISDTALPRIFEPFYTTKAPGQGTGLGLSLAYDIAVGHGGTLMAGRSEAGGALFTVTLPLAAVPADAAA